MYYFARLTPFLVPSKRVYLIPDVTLILLTITASKSSWTSIKLQEYQDTKIACLLINYSENGRKEYHWRS